MQNIQNIAREALKEILKSGKEPTPEVYAEAYYAQAKKLGIPIEAEFSITQVLEMLDKEAKESLLNTPFKNKNALFVALTRSINRLFFFRKSFHTVLEILKLLLRLLAVHSQKEVASLAKGNLLEIDKLNAQFMQIWRERWMEQVKRIPDFDDSDFSKALEILSAFKIPDLEFQKWQDCVKNELKNPKLSKEAQIKLLKELEIRISGLKKQGARTTRSKIPSTQTTQAAPKEPISYPKLASLPMDAATTLVSKEGMEEVLNFAEDVFLERKENYAVIVFGIAEYENIKIRFGAEAAKRILETLGRLLKQYSNARDLIAYYGDEEFLACLLEREKTEAIAFIRNLDEIVRKSKFMFQQMRLAIKLTAQVAHRVEAKDLESMLKMSLEEFEAHKDSQGIIRYE